MLYLNSKVFKRNSIKHNHSIKMSLNKYICRVNIMLFIIYIIIINLYRLFEVYIYKEIYNLNANISY